MPEEISMTQRQINNFLKKNGEVKGFHLFVDYPGLDPKSVYRWFEENRTINELYELWAADEKIISVQYIGNCFFMKHAA